MIDSLLFKARRRVARLGTWRWRNAAYRSNARPIVIGGCPRSGTTMLRRTLDAHSNIVCGPETSLFLPGVPSVGQLAQGYGLSRAEVEALLRASPSQAAFIEAFFARVLSGTNATRWAEKTPLNLRSLPWIWRRFPEARFIHLIRDGRDVACSMRLHPERRFVNGTWTTVREQVPIRECIERWHRDVTLGLTYRDDPRFIELRYEALVEQPRSELERLFAFLEEPFEEAVLSYRRDRPAPDPSATAEAQAGPSATDHTKTDSTAIETEVDSATPAEAGGPPPEPTIHARSRGRWRTDLTSEEQRLFKELAGPLLIKLGYEQDNAW